MVSVIIPNYNHGHFLKQRIDSVLGQTYRDFEIVLLDDCSTDNSRDILAIYAGHPKVKHFVLNEINSGGPFRQWRKGVEFTVGEYIWIAESDDYADSYFLERLVPILDKQKKVGIVYADSWLVDEHGDELPLSDETKRRSEFWNSSFKMDGRRAIDDLMFHRNAIPNASAVLFRREIFQSIPLTYLDFKATGDWLVWIEMLKLCDLYFVSEKLNYFRSHPAVTRIHRDTGKRLQVLKERYIILQSLNSGNESVERVLAAYDGLAYRILRAIGFKKIFTTTAWRTSEQFLVYDGGVRRRMLKAAWKKFAKAVKVKVLLILKVS